MPLPPAPPFPEAAAPADAAVVVVVDVDAPAATVDVEEGVAAAAFVAVELSFPLLDVERGVDVGAAGSDFTDRDRFTVGDAAAAFSSSPPVTLLRFSAVAVVAPPPLEGIEEDPEPPFTLTKGDLAGSLGFASESLREDLVRVTGLSSLSAATDGRLVVSSDFVFERLTERLVFVGEAFPGAPLSTKV